MRPAAPVSRFFCLDPPDDLCGVSADDGIRRHVLRHHRASGEAAFSGVVRGNRTLGTVLELLKEDTDEAAVVAAMRERFDAPEGAVERDVARVLAELRKIGALEEEAP